MYTLDMIFLYDINGTALVLRMSNCKHVFIHIDYPGWHDWTKVSKLDDQ